MSPASTAGTALTALAAVKLGGAAAARVLGVLSHPQAELGVAGDAVVLTAGEQPDVLGQAALVFAAPTSLLGGNLWWLRGGGGQTLTCHVCWSVALTATYQSFLDAVQDPGLAELGLVRLGGDLTVEIFPSQRAQLLRQVGQQAGPGPSLQGGELLSLVTRVLSVDQLRQQKLLELLALPEHRGAGQAGAEVRDVRPGRDGDFVAGGLARAAAQGLHHDVGVQEVGGDDVGGEGRVLLLEHQGHDIVPNVSLSLELLLV